MVMVAEATAVVEVEVVAEVEVEAKEEAVTGAAENGVFF